MPTTLTTNNLAFLLIGVLLNAAAQLLLKKGMSNIGYFDFAWHNVFPIGLKIIANPYIFIGLLSYVVSLISWLVVLSRLDVSYAYPMLSIGYVVVAIASYYLFQEPLTFQRLSGIFVIIIGIYLLNRS